MNFTLREPVLDVYVAEIPQEVKLSSLYPPERAREINACKSEKVKREKYCVWTLLEYALERTFGQKIETMQFIKTASGKWQTKNFEFSLSHSKNAVAVALSSAPVGVDIEIFAPIKMEGFAEKILTPTEYAAYQAQENKAEYLFEKWTQKESLFKQREEQTAPAFRIETENAQTHTRQVEIAGEKYFLSVVSEHIQKLRFYENIHLKQF